MRTTGIAVAVVLLAGCGGGGGSDSAVSANPQACGSPVQSLLNGTSLAAAESVWRCQNSSGTSYDFVAFKDGTGRSSAVGNFTWSEQSCGVVAVTGREPQTLDNIRVQDANNVNFRVTFASGGATRVFCSTPNVPDFIEGGSTWVTDSVRQRTVVIGGVTSFGRERIGIKATWVREAGVWTNARTAIVPPTLPVAALTSTPEGLPLLVSASIDGPIALWRLDGSGWTSLPGANPPPQRGYHKVSFDTDRKRLVLFGGSPGGSGVSVFDTWEWDGERWTAFPFSDSPCIEGRPGTPPTPCVVYSGSDMRYDSAAKLTVLTGYNASSKTVYWTWDGKDWAPTASRPPTPSPAPEPPPAPDPTPTPPAPQPPAVTDDTVDAGLIGAVLYQGISEDPAKSGNPYTHAHTLASADGQASILLGSYGRYEMGANRLGDGFPSAFGVGIYDDTRVKAIIADGVIAGVEANGESYAGSRVNIASGRLPLNTTVGTWSRDGYTVKLVLTTMAERPDVMRVCWDVYLPPPQPIIGPPGYVAPPHLVRTEPFKRLMCGLYGRYVWSGNIGGYVIDERDGVHYTMTGYW